MMINGLTSVKLVVYEPPDPPKTACTTLVRPPAVCQVTTRSLPCGVIEVICKNDAAFVGIVPERYSCRLFMPSPSKSLVALATAPVTVPKYWYFQPSVIPSPDVDGFSGLLPL